MGTEIIFDISEEASQETLNKWDGIVTNPVAYVVASLKKWGGTPEIRPLYNKVFRSAYENGASEGENAREIRFAGSFITLDAVETDLIARSARMVITPDDYTAYKKFLDDFLIDPRWRELTEIRDGMESIKPGSIDEYKRLLQETGGPGVDISLLVDILESKGRNRLIDTTRECAEILFRNFDPPQREVGKAVFMGGVWTVLPMLAIKYSGRELEKLLRDGRVADSRIN